MLSLHFVFRRSVEILTDRYYTLGTRFLLSEPHNQGQESPISQRENHQYYHPIETVWGGGGEKVVSSMEAKSRFHFDKISREGIRSSWANGQIPILYFV